MAAVSGATRKYDSSRRRQQARATKIRILDAARDLFVERGYSGTTLAAVAERADIALPTVYAAAGSKRAILAELIEGDGRTPEDRARILAPDDIARIHDALSPGAAIDLLADRVTASLEAGYELLTVMRAAAGVEAEAAELERRVQQGRLDDLRDAVDLLIADGKLPSGASAQAVAETLWSLTDIQVFHMLVKERGWAVADFRDWLGVMISAYLRLPTAG